MSELSELFVPKEYFMFKSCDSDCYRFFNTNLKKYFEKFPNDEVKLVLSPLFDNNLIMLGHPIEHKNLLLGQVIETYDNKIAGIIINFITHDIDQDGNSLSFDKVVLSVYFILIKYIIDEQKKVNFDLIQKVEFYFSKILIKYLKLSELQEHKKILFDFLVKVLFYNIFGKININIAYEKSMNKNNEELVKKYIKIEKLSKYNNVLNIYDALYDFEIVLNTPNNMKYMLSNVIGMMSFITISSSIGSLIASFIMSKYRHINFSALLISLNDINSIEHDVIETYLKTLSFDSKILHKTINDKLDKIKAKI
jgi:hypothetical protein